MKEKHNSVFLRTFFHVIGYSVNVDAYKDHYTK